MLIIKCITSVLLFITGTDPNTLFSDIYQHFIGCLRDIRFTNKDQKHVPVPVETIEGVEEGCIDKCTNNPCHHGGQCVNTYSDAICDCFGTDYQGPFCSELGKTHLNVFFSLHFFLSVDRLLSQTS